MPRKVIKWSDEEDEILRELYPHQTITIYDLQKVLSDRSYNSIVHRIRVLGLVKEKGSTIDLDYLKSLREVIKG